MDCDCLKTYFFLIKYSISHIKLHFLLADILQDDKSRALRELTDHLVIFVISFHHANM